jgi:hypothetical protein
MRRALWAGSVALVLAVPACTSSASHPDVSSSTPHPPVSSPASSSTPSSTPAPGVTSTPPVPTSGGRHRSTTVEVTGGSEVATWTDSGRRVVVWRRASGAPAWTQQDVVDLPDPPEGSATNGLNVTGAVVSGGSDATFVLGGTFTMDGGTNAFVLGRGRTGWGLLARPTPESATLSVAAPPTGWFRAAFRDGLLVTASLNTFFPLFQGVKFPLVSYWRAAGSRFTLDHDNVTEASRTAPPPSSAGQLPDSCPGAPPDGTYITSVAAKDYARKGNVAGDEVTLTFPILGPGTGQCTVHAKGNLPTEFDTDRGWVTGPLWLVLFEQSQIGDYPDLKIPLPGDAHRAGTRWLVPSSLGISSLVSLGQGGQWTLTFRDGTLVGAGY